MTTSKRKLVSLGAIIAIILLAGFCLLTTSAWWKLSRIGYNADEIDIIMDRLNRDNLKPILEVEYIPELIQILSERPEPADFRVEKLADYIQAEQKYDFLPESVVQLVNHADYDTNTEYNERRFQILYSEYFLSRNLERYFTLEASDEQEELETNEIIALVNTNRDRDYYTETESAKLENSKILLVNKYYYLDRDFIVDLVEQEARYGNVGERMEVETYAAFEEMFRAAEADGHQLYVTSGYRGYEEQEEVFAGYLVEGGEEYALQYAAKPGYSEHQTGRAIDVFTPGETTSSFANSPVAAWLAEHAYEYGFILRYPDGKENLTGYNYEPWHYRYVGREAATEIQKRNITLEEYVAVFSE